MKIPNRLSDLRLNSLISADPLNLPILFIILIIILLFPLIYSQNSTSCNRFCGHSSDPVPFPFGFSNECKIPLNCSQNNSQTIGDFLIKNITPDGILINLPPDCNRPINISSKLFGTNYAPTSQNGLLFRNCNKKNSSSVCALPPLLLEQQFQTPRCNSKGDNITCFTNDNDNNSFISPENVTGSGCDYLYSAIMADVTRNSSVWLEFWTLELGFWLEGECNCSDNATCTNFTSPVTHLPSFRCRCIEGFDGDGFLAGLGCQRVTVPPRCNRSNTSSGSCGGSSQVARVGVLIGGIAAGAFLMTGLALLYCFIRRRSNSSRRFKSTRRLLSEATGSSVPLYQYKEIEKSTNFFSEKQRLGTGAYGTVYAGKLHNDEWVAVKKIRHRDYDGIEQVMNEIKLLSSVSHPNLVRLLGCCIERGEQILVYEFMPNGTLSQHLQRERGNGLPWTTRLTIAAETAKAIAYLHSAMNPPIFHRDIKSSNILLDHNFKSKVADFGLSRLGMTEISHISTAPQGTPGYLDPQYHQEFHLSDKSDVYSFGVVLVEIITALKVVDFSRMHNEVNLAALAIDKIGKGCVDEIIDQFLEPHRDAWTLTSVHKVAELAFRCLAFHRDMRPSMMEVADELEQIRLSGWAEAEENVYSSGSSMSNCGENLGTPAKKMSSGSRKLVVLPRGDSVISMVDNETSPVSIQDPWVSEHSSPSSNSLLGNVIQ
ncbi:wall-associated receptor kinase-like 14 [Tasmannia lanceolata]|uniref:wall-associated receptor kinase-like 14 n=1 Tax=Tasmannia lanceolata TaxID=3420 RepID=UPI0040634527